MFLNVLFLLVLFTFFMQVSSFINLFKSILGKPTNKNISKTVPLNDIYECARLSELAYEFDYVFKSRENNKYLECINHNNIKCPDCNFIKFIKNKTNLHCLITKNDKSKKYIVIFKGTSKLVNWIYNVKMRKINLNDNFKKNSYVHLGFYLQLMQDDVIGQIQEVISDAPDDYDVWFCGHSAGGAHSVLSSYILAKKFPFKDIKTFTFASPRIGNKNFAENFSKVNNLEHWRVSYGNDIFTAVPLINYHHFGNSLRLSKNKVEHGEYNKFYTFSVLKCFSFFDHHPKFYTRELEKLLTFKK